MKDFKITVQRLIKGGIRSFHNFPASIFSAIVVAIVAFIRIEMDYDVEQSFNFLFDSIQFAFIFGAVFSMVLTATNQLDTIKIPKKIPRLAGILPGLLAFILLYLFGAGTDDQGFRYLTEIASARISVAIFISIVIFIYTIAKEEKIKDFPSAFFITHKAFVVSLIYGLVLMVGVSGVLGAFQTLVYSGVSYKLYQYLAVVIGFLTYTIFLGYFPIFVDDKEIYNDNEKELQPRFIIVLFDYILIPIIIALTLVLFTWSARVLLNGIDVSFNQLSGIATSYIFVGIWLHIMVANHNTGISEFYKRAYPFSAILILLFEGWALVVQLGELGLKTSEYFFILLWVFAAISVGLLIYFNKDSYRKIALLASIISLIGVLPLIGYHTLPFKMQINRLEGLLIEENLLVDNTLVRNDKEVDKKERIFITEAVDFIFYSEEGEKPEWFKDDLNRDTVFEDTFGFKKTYDYQDYLGDNTYLYTTIVLDTQAIDISDYDLSINIGYNEKDKSTTFFERDGNNYELIWDSFERGIPKIIVKTDDRLIIEEDLEEFLNKVEKEHPSTNYNDIKGSLEDMSYKIETDEISLLLVFNTININNDTKEGRKDYYMDINTIYIK